MDRFGADTRAFCLIKLDEMIDCVAAMDDATVNAPPDLRGVNNAYQVLTQCLGMLDQWTKEYLLGEPFSRDRDAEFEASGLVHELVGRARARRQA